MDAKVLLITTDWSHIYHIFEFTPVDFVAYIFTVFSRNISIFEFSTSPIIDSDRRTYVTHQLYVPQA